MTNSYAVLGRQRDKAKRARNVIDAAVDSRRQGKNAMRTMFKMAITATLAMVLIGMGFVSGANAQCAGSGSFKVGGIQQQSWEGAPHSGSLVPASRQSYGRRCRYRWLLEGEVHF